MALVAAIVAAAASLVVATLVFAWQRRLEQSFLLRTEKREIYRRFLAAAAPIGDTVTAPGFLDSRTFRELSAIVNEIGLVGSDATVAAANTFLGEVAKAHDHVVDARIDDPRVLAIARGLGAMTAILRHDLDTTVPATILPRWASRGLASFSRRGAANAP